MADFNIENWANEIARQYGNPKIQVPKGGFSLQGNLDNLVAAVNNAQKPKLSTKDIVDSAPAQLMLDYAAQKGMPFPEFITKLVTNGKITTVKELGELINTLPDDFKMKVATPDGKGGPNIPSKAQLDAIAQKEAQTGMALAKFAMGNGLSPHDIVRALTSAEMITNKKVNNGLTPDQVISKYVQCGQEILNTVLNDQNIQGPDDAYIALLFAYTLLNGIIEKKPISLMGHIGGNPVDPQEAQMQSAIDTLMKGVFGQ